MSYSHFETGNAEYWVLLGQHDVYRTDIHKLRGRQIDAAVLEDAGLGSKMLGLDDIEHSPITRFARERGIPVFTLDVPARNDVWKYEQLEDRLILGGVAGAIVSSSAASIMLRRKIMTRRRFIALGGMCIGSLCIAAAGYAPSIALPLLRKQGREFSETSRRIVSLETRLVETELVTMRNAVNARKIEEYLAPMLMQRLGRKPSIVLAYGTYHAGLEEHISDKSLRDSVISNYSDVLYADASDEFQRQLRNVYEFVPLEYGFENAVKHNCSCF